MSTRISKKLRKLKKASDEVLLEIARAQESSDEDSDCTPDQSRLNRKKLVKSINEISELFPATTKSFETKRMPTIDKKKGLLERMRKLVQESGTKFEEGKKKSTVLKNSDEDLLEKSVEAREETNQGLQSINDSQGRQDNNTDDNKEDKQTNENTVSERSNTTVLDESSKNETKDDTNQKNDQNNPNDAIVLQNRSEFAEYFEYMADVVMKPIQAMFGALFELQSSKLRSECGSDLESDPFCNEITKCQISDGTTKDLSVGMEIICSAFEKIPAEISKTYSELANPENDIIVESSEVPEKIFVADDKIVDDTSELTKFVNNGANLSELENNGHEPDENKSKPSGDTSEMAK